MPYVKKLKELRTQRGKSQADIAEVLNTTQQYYCCYENRKRELPIHHLITLCKYYNTSADEMLGLSDE